MTLREKRLIEARSVFHGVGFDSLAAQAEACEYLKSKYKLSREEIGSALNLTERQVKTRLTQYKFYASKGMIPSVEFSPYAKTVLGETPQEEVIQDEAERLHRVEVAREFRGSVKTSLLEQKLIASIVPNLPSKLDLKALTAFYKEAKKDRPRGKNEPETAIATISDLHLCQQGPAFNFAKAESGLNRYLSKVLYITNRHRQSVPVNDIYVNFLGDNLNGTANFPSQKWSVDRPSILQVDALTELFVKAIETLLLDFDKVVVTGMSGNHAKIVQNSEDPDISNWERVVHKAIQIAFRHDKRITVNVPDDWFTVVQVNGGIKLLLTHGHHLPGSGSFDGLVKVFKSYQNTLPEFNAALIGHYHRFARLPLSRAVGSTIHPTLYINGAAPDSDDYILKFGGAPTPIWWFMFANDHRVTAEYSIDLYGYQER